jgi:hypothetical protein
MAVGAMALTVVAVIAACGSQTAGPAGSAPAQTSESASPTSSVVDLDREVAARGMLMQTSSTADVELCLGAVQTSYPPGCGGPRVVGKVDWEALEAESVAGRTWSSGDVWAVGHLDPDAGTAGTLTLTRPLSTTPPEGVTLPPQLTSPRFPQLCDDPYAGGGRPGGGTTDTQNALAEQLPTLEGYVGSWVSDGSSVFNVLVTGDATAARDTLRETWKGGLCVQQRDLPTEKDVRAAQDALSSLPGLLSSSGNAPEGRLEVEVVVLDAATLDRVLASVRPWLDADQVRVRSAFTALP